MAANQDHEPDLRTFSCFPADYYTFINVLLCKLLKVLEFVCKYVFVLFQNLTLEFDMRNLSFFFFFFQWLFNGDT